MAILRTIGQKISQEKFSLFLQMAQICEILFSLKFTLRADLLIDVIFLSQNIELRMFLLP